MLQEQIGEKGVVQPQAEILYGSWPEKRRITSAQASDTDGSLSRKSKAMRIWPDVRECSGCGSLMTSARYRRQAIRFLSTYRCNACGHRFEQETRGFQGFYIGCLLTLAMPVAALTIQGVFTPTQLFGLGVVLGLLMVPIHRNVKLFKTEPVLLRPRGSRLMSRRSGRNMFGRILGGDSPLFGFLLAVFSIVVSLIVVFSGAFAASAMAA